MTVALDRSSFGKAANGAAVELFTFSHVSGLTLAVTNYGAVIQSLQTPAKDGKLADIILGYDTLEQYEADERLLGCVVGRYANRIASGRFSIDGQSYQLQTNAKGHHIHGGSNGFNRQIWQPSIEQKNGLPVLELTHVSQHGHEGYPGTVICKVVYAVTKSAEIEISYHATTDRPTVINLTNHSYFNLAGHRYATENGVLAHHLQLHADEFLPTDDCGIPLSDPVTVAATPMDFRAQKSLVRSINDRDQQLENGNGYDHTWVVNHAAGSGASVVSPAALLTDPESGRSLHVATTQPGIQVYTANYVDNLNGKDGAVYQRRGSVCLETQHYPDSPNRSSFPSTLYTPERPLYEVTVLKPGL